MNWEKLLTKYIPIALKVVREMFQGVADGASDEEIMERMTSPDGILRTSLAQLRDDEDDLLDFVRTGK